MGNCFHFIVIVATFFCLFGPSTQNISVCQTCSAQLNTLNYSVNVVECPANCWSQTPDVCGTGLYTSGSICQAAMHAGVVSNSGGIVTVYKAGLTTATGSLSFGINSSTCANQAIGYTFHTSCQTTGNPQYGVTTLRCPANCSGQMVCGDGIYSSNSSICAAAIHSGIITNAGGEVRIIRRPGQASYTGSTNNSVTSQSCGSSPTSFIFNISLPTDECKLLPATSCGYGNCTQAINAHYCSCNPGYTGANCSQNINDCASNPCQNGSCTDLVNDYNCTCNYGFGGKNCSNYIGQCFEKPCLNGGSCVSGSASSYTCTCKPGWTGKNCSININECASNPCMNGGSCTDLVNGFNCSCPFGYNGTTCSFTVDECASFPCKNGGSCTDKILDFNCTCQLGYSGKRCETPPPSCSGVTCLTNGFCNSKTLACECKPGYTATPPTGTPTLCQLRCPREVVSKNGTDYTFPGTTIGSNVFSNETCSDGRAIASASCVDTNNTKNPAARFAQIEVVPCAATVTNVISTINVTNTSAITTQVVSQSLSRIAIVTSSPKNATNTPISASDTQNAINILVAFNNTNPTTVAITTSALYDSIAVVSVLATSVAAANESQATKAQQSNQLVSVLKEFSKRVTIPPSETTVTLATTDISMQVSLPVINADNKTENVTLAKDPANPLPIAATVPGNLLDTLAATTTNNIVPRVTFIVFLNDTLFKPAVPSPNKPTTIITITIDSFTTLPAGNPIDLTFEENATYGEGAKTPGNPTKAVWTNFECGGWDPVKQVFTKLCTFYNGTTQKSCVCNEIGSLSLLFNTQVLPSSFIQEWFSTVGLSLSSAGLALTIIIYLAVSDLRSRQSTIFLINICICLLATNLLFLLGVSNVRKDVDCYVTTVLLHYFLLASWCWMTSNGYNMYRALVQVMKVKSTRAWKVAAIFSYLLPLAIVAITAGITLFYLDPKITDRGPLFQSTYRARNMCWLQILTLRYSFIIPVALLAVANVLFCSSIIVHLTCKRGQIQSSAAERTLSHNMIVAVTLICMLGVTWVFGFLMLAADNTIYLEVTSWLFCIFNVFQGLIIFILNCVRQPSIRAMWLHPVVRFITCGKFYASKPATTTKSTSAPYTSQVNSSKI